MKTIPQFLIALICLGALLGGARLSGQSGLPVVT